MRVSPVHALVVGHRGGDFAHQRSCTDANALQSQEFVFLRHPHTGRADLLVKACSILRTPSGTHRVNNNKANADGGGRSPASERTARTPPPTPRCRTTTRSCPLFARRSLWCRVAVISPVSATGYGGGQGGGTSEMAFLRTELLDDVFPLNHGQRAHHGPA